MVNRLPLCSNRKRWHRLAGFVWLAVFLIWLPFEDTNVGSAVFLASGVSVLAILKIARNWREKGAFWRFAALGLITGVSIPLLAATLMVFKSGLHAHGFSDFPISQFNLVLSAIPLAAVIGLMLSLVYLRLINRGGESS